MRKCVWILPVMLTLSACGSGKPESLEDCVGRFKKSLPTIGSNFGKQRFDFTYRLSGSARAVDTAVLKRARITATDGDANEQAIKKFLSEELYPGGQFLFANNIALYRVPGPEAKWDTAIETACQGTPPDSSLYRVNAFPIPASSKPD